MWTHLATVVYDKIKMEDVSAGNYRRSVTLSACYCNKELSLINETDKTIRTLHDDM